MLVNSAWTPSFKECKLENRGDQGNVKVNGYTEVLQNLCIKQISIYNFVELIVLQTKPPWLPFEDQQYEEKLSRDLLESRAA